MVLTRRGLLALGAGAALAGRWARDEALANEPPPLQLGEARPFSPAFVRNLARELSTRPYSAVPNPAGDTLRNLTYDQFRDIRFRRDAAVWRDEGLPAEVQFFHVGHVFADPVQVNLVWEGTSRHVMFSPQMFDYGPLVPDPVPDEDVGFSGFRLHGPLNGTDYLDEFTVFQGASYFRAIGREQVYGQSARGLSIRTAEPEGEEFPAFREFWIEKPRPGASSVVVHALLDSPSTTGAYRFTIRPGADTVIDVEAVLFPRVDLDKVGLATLTSMFYFGPQDRLGIDDFRPAVHDTDGLLIWNGRDEWIWRPLINPTRLQLSAFLDQHPQGFGLLQRARGFPAFQDLEARYERRPSVWVEPIGDWGEGAVMLVEIPTGSEVHDNIVAFWRPAAPLVVGEDQVFTYRLHWCRDVPPQSGLAEVVSTMVGGPGVKPEGAPDGVRWIVIDFVGGALAGMAPDDQPVPDVSTGAGALVPGSIQFNPETGGRRVAFGLDPQGELGFDLRCALLRDGQRISEAWVFRWAE